MQMLHFEEAKVGNTAHGSGKSLNQNGTSTFSTKSSWTHSVAKLWRPISGWLNYVPVLTENELLNWVAFLTLREIFMVNRIPILTKSLRELQQRVNGHRLMRGMQPWRCRRINPRLTSVINSGEATSNSRGCVCLVNASSWAVGMHRFYHCFCIFSGCIGT